MVAIALTLIDAAERLRPVNEDRALLLAAGMAEEGLRVPIEVRPLNKRGLHPLITGGHRLRAAILLDWTEIEAEILDLTADEARLREINENLFRADLTELDRAVFLAEKKRLYEKRHPETRHGGDRRSDQVPIVGNLAPRFSDDACERLGLSKSALYRTIARAALPANVRALLAGTPIANNGAQLDALLRLEPVEQLHVARALASQMPDAPSSVAAAVKLLREPNAPVAPEPDPSDAQYQALLGAWRKCSDRRARDRFLAFLASQDETLPEIDGEA